MRNLAFLIVLATITLIIGCGRQRSSTPLLSTLPSAAVDNDIYLADERGRIRALRPDGSEQWTVSLPDEITSRDNTASRESNVGYVEPGAELRFTALTFVLGGVSIENAKLHELLKTAFRIHERAY